MKVIKTVKRGPDRGAYADARAAGGKNVVSPARWKEPAAGSGPGKVLDPAQAGGKLPRMRTLRQAVDEIQATDPNTAITYHFLRGCILRGELPFVQVGKKRLIDMDMLDDFLNDRMQRNAPAEEEFL